MQPMQLCQTLSAKATEETQARAAQVFKENERAVAEMVKIKEAAKLSFQLQQRSSSSSLPQCSSSSSLSSATSSSLDTRGWKSM